MATSARRGRATDACPNPQLHPLVDVPPFSLEPPWPEVLPPLADPPEPLAALAPLLPFAPPARVPPLLVLPPPLPRLPPPPLLLPRRPPRPLRSPCACCVPRRAPCAAGTTPALRCPGYRWSPATNLAKRRSTNRLLLRGAGTPPAQRQGEGQANPRTPIPRSTFLTVNLRGTPTMAALFFFNAITVDHGIFNKRPGRVMHQHFIRIGRKRL